MVRNPGPGPGFLVATALWGDGTQVTNIPGGSLGQAVYDQLGEAGGGQATITIDFELIDEEISLMSKLSSSMCALRRPH